MEKIFFHSMQWDNDVYFTYLVWPFALVLVLYVLRVAYNMLRPKKLTHKRRKYYMVRDLFLELGSIEYLLIFNLLYAVYLFFWAYKTNPLAAKWDTSEPYLIILPQVITIIADMIFFFVGYTKFRKPLIKK